MKKFVWILLVSVFVSPVLAQESSIIRAGAKLAAPSGEMALRVTQQVEKQAALRAAEAVSATRVAQITNWVSKPSIRVQQAANTETSLGSKEQAAAVAAPGYWIGMPLPSISFPKDGTDIRRIYLLCLGNRQNPLFTEVLLSEDWMN